MEIKLAAQGAELAAFAAVEDRLADAERAAETGDDSSDRRNLHPPSGVADQKYASRPDAALNRRPPVIHWNARSLEPEWRESALFHEALQAAARFLAVF